MMASKKAKKAAAVKQPPLINGDEEPSTADSLQVMRSTLKTCKTKLQAQRASLDSDVGDKKTIAADIKKREERVKELETSIQVRSAVAQKEKEKAGGSTANQGTSRAIGAFKPPMVTRSRSEEPSVPAWKKTQDENRAGMRAASFEEFGEELPERPQDRQISPPKAPKKKPAKASNPDEEEFRPEEEEEDSETDEEESSEEDRRKGKGVKQAAKSSAAKSSTAVDPKTRGGVRSGAGRKKRSNTDNDNVPAKRSCFNFSGKETL